MTMQRHNGTKRAAALGLALTLPLALGGTTGARGQAPLVPPAARSVTLDDVVATALRNNSSVLLAQERLRKSQEQIAQVNAQAKPQVRVDVTDTLSSARAFGAGAGGNLQSPTLPGGGQIPVIIDQGGGNSNGFVGGGGGGTTSSNGQSGVGIGGGTGVGTGTAGGGTGTGGAGAGGFGTGAGTTGTGTGTTGTGATGAGGATGTGSTGTGGAGALIATAEMPSVVRDYAAQSRIASYTIRRPLDDQGSTNGTGAAGSGTGAVGTTTGSRGNFNNYNGRLSVTQYLDIFNLVGTARDVQNITRDFYALDLQRVANETALNAKNTFFSVLRAQDQVAVQQEQVNFATENLRIAQARFNAGATARFDVLTAQTNLANARQQLSQSQNQLALTQANLNNLLGLSQDQPLAPQTPPLPALNQTFDSGQTVKTAYARRPELRQADNNIVIAQKLIRLAGSSLKPTLGLVGSANYAGPSAVSDGRHETFSLSAVLGVPLSDGGTARSRVRSARIDLETQNVTKSQLQQNVELEVRQALINIANAQTRTAASAQAVSQAEEAVRLAQVRYQNGISTFLEVTNAQANLAQARTNLSGAQFDYQTALAQLTRAEGGR